MKILHFRRSTETDVTVLQEVVFMRENEGDSMEQVRPLELNTMEALKANEIKRGNDDRKPPRLMLPASRRAVT